MVAVFSTIHRESITAFSEVNTELFKCQRPGGTHRNHWALKGWRRDVHSPCLA